MAEHSVNSGYMQGIVDDLQRVTSSLEDALAEADQVAARMRAVWSGEAADAHQGAHDRWAADAKAMNGALARLLGVLDTAKSNYSGAVSANEQMWS